MGLRGGFAEVGNRDRFLFHREATFTPGIETAQQRAYAGYPLAFEQQRHTGASGFAGSSAVEHDVAVAGNFQVALLDFLGAQVYGAGHFRLVGLEFHGMA